MRDALPVTVQASALLCIAELVSCLGPHVIATLPDIMLLAINALQQNSPSRFGSFSKLIKYIVVDTFASIWKLSF